MRLPAMKYVEGNRKKTQVKFGGLNHTLGAKDGELWDMQNLTGDHFPVLSSRAPRVKLRQMDVSGGLLHWNKLCWIDGTDFYYDGVRKGGVEEGLHTLAAIGSYIVIFPERFYYNTESDTFGDLQAFWCGDTLNFERTEGADRIQCEGFEAEDYFAAGDAVTISGCEVAENNRTAVIRRVEHHGYLYFDKNTFIITPEEGYTEDTQGNNGLMIERRVPDLKFICESENRLWGCDGKRIFASMPGDPFRWYNREGLETDGWDVDTGSAGEFTGCIAYQGSPIFFKEDHIYKVYGSYPSQYQVVDTAAQGVMTGCGKSLAVADGILFYLSRGGVMAYSGGMPQNIAKAFGQQRFCDGVAGSDGEKYYISMRTGQEWGLYVYDTRIGLWFKEDATQARGFAWDDGILFMLTANGDLMAIGDYDAYGENVSPGDLPEGEGPVAWCAEFADFTEEDPNKKGICKLQLRLELDEGARAQVYMMFDSDGVWHKVGTELSADVKRSYTLPIVPRRADHYRLKIEGTGPCRIYSLTVETYSGSEFRSKEGRN